MTEEVIDEGKKMAVVEIFGPTIQGEGGLIGMQTFFLRMGGCDYLCDRCDSLHAVLPHLMKQEPTFRRMTADELADELIRKMGHCKWLTISGGNPCMWKDLGKVIHRIAMDIEGPQKFVAVETQGTIWQEWLRNCDLVTVSPKGPGMGEKFEPEKFDKFIQELYPIDGYTKGNFLVKVPIFDQRDIELAVSIMERWPQTREVMFLSIGNVNPPQPAKADGFAFDALVKVDPHMGFVKQVLDSYRMLLDDIMQDPRLAGVRILPQLHTLLWGNEKGK